MKKETKHHFTHSDPETRPIDPKEKGADQKSIKPVNPVFNIIKKDLKKTLITVSFFVVLLIVFYLINQKYNLLTYLGTLFSL